MSLEQSHHSRSEIRSMVTPYAFGVSDDLLGTPLASPFKRAVAICIDILAVSLLTNLSGTYMLALVTFLSFKAITSLRKSKRFYLARWAMVFSGISSFLLILSLISSDGMGAYVADKIEAGFGDSMQSSVTTDGSFNEQEMSLLQTGIFTKEMIQAASLATTLLENYISPECGRQIHCLEEELDAFTADFAGSGLPLKSASQVFTAMTEILSEELTDEQVQSISRYLETQYRSYLPISDNSSESSSESQAELLLEMPLKSPDNKLPDVEEAISSNVEEDKSNQVINDDSQELKKEDETSPSILTWMKHFADDLGIGFGWAALYFSVVTAWSRGQSIGKRITGIKVIKLDGSTLDLWESFGRYGGYGAGFATGLLGFLQVFWDPNRQAIQDKISETLVIDINRPKMNFHEGIEKAD